MPIATHHEKVTRIAAQMLRTAVAALVARRYEDAFNHSTREIGGGGVGLPEKSKHHFPIETPTVATERALCPRHRRHRSCSSPERNVTSKLGICGSGSTNWGLK